MGKTKPTIPKGTRDYNPQMMVRRQFIFNTIKTVFEKFAYMPLETPSMENLEVLTGKYGDEGDQLLFKILNSGNYLYKSQNLPSPALSEAPIDRLEPSSKSTLQQLTKDISKKGLRYDLTVPFARFVAMNQNDISFPFKRYQIQPVWRADKPQKGRYQEFYQCDADVVGTDSLICEAEIIQMMTEVFAQLGIEDYDIKINNRKILSGIAALLGAESQAGDLFVAIDKLDKIGVDKVLDELRGKGFDEKALEDLRSILQLEGNNAELQATLTELLQDETGKLGLAELTQVFDYLDKFGADKSKVVFDVTLARGLSYYTGAIFEVKVNNVSIGSISGGGRYDDLTSSFGLNGVSGVGFSFGVDRIYDVMEELHLFQTLPSNKTQVMIVNFGEQEESYALGTLRSLREAGINAEIYPTSAKMKKQMQYADKKGIPHVVLLGEEEMTTGMLTVKEMESGEQHKIPLSTFIERVK